MKKLSLLYILFLLACSKNDPDPGVGPLTLEFDNRLEDHPGFTITYDVTEIKLKRDDGYVFDNKSQSYHVDASDEGSQEISIKDIPSGNYTEVTFTVKSMNVSGDFEFQSDISTYVLPMSGAPVRPEHEPEVHLIFSVDKVNSNVQEAFTVDHIHAN